MKKLLSILLALVLATGLFAARWTMMPNPAEWRIRPG